MTATAPRASLTLIGLLACAVLVSALAVVYAKHQSRKLFIELQGLQVTRDEMNVEWGQLQLEQSTLATHAMIDNVARSKLGMGTPAPQDIVIIQPGAARRAAPPAALADPAAAPGEAARP